eukprot:2784019-Amphidinium_carterae.1
MVGHDEMRSWGGNWGSSGGDLGIWGWWSVGESLDVMVSPPWIYWVVGSSCFSFAMWGMSSVVEGCLGNDLQRQSGLFVQPQPKHCPKAYLPDVVCPMILLSVNIWYVVRGNFSVEGMVNCGGNVTENVTSLNSHSAK